MRSPVSLLGTAVLASRSVSRSYALAKRRRPRVAVAMEPSQEDSNANSDIASVPCWEQVDDRRQTDAWRLSGRSSRLDPAAPTRAPKAAIRTSRDPAPRRQAHTPTRKEPNVIGCFYDHGHWVGAAPAKPSRDRRHAGRRAPGRVPRRRRRPRRAAAVPPDGGRRPRPGAAPADGRVAPRLRRAAGAARQRADGDRPPGSAPFDAAVDRVGTRAQARAVVVYATTADRRGFCFFGNPAAR
jgi:hypothetical protein